MKTLFDTHTRLTKHYLLRIALPRQLNIHVCINIHMVVGLCTKYMFSQSASRPFASIAC